MEWVKLYTLMNYQMTFELIIFSACRCDSFTDLEADGKRGNVKCTCYKCYWKLSLRHDDIDDSKPINENISLPLLCP
jgi:hypothetical protein